MLVEQIRDSYFFWYNYAIQRLVIMFAPLNF